MGFEPMTSCLLDRRSNQLSYGALVISGGEETHLILWKNVAATKPSKA